MEKVLHAQSKGLRGTIEIPGDKSISHRAIMFGALAQGRTTITNFLEGEDCLSTISCFQKMGVSIERADDKVIVDGAGIKGLQEPTEILDVGNSGTTTRLMLGILASQPFHAVIIGDASIAKRPMDRVTIPLRQMGAVLDGREDGRFTPLSIRGGNLHPLQYESPVASAQVKSCVLLAGLGANGVTSVTEPHLSRDHTERMLQAFGAEVVRDGLTVSVAGGQELHATDVHVPGDISSAAFFLTAGAIVQNSELTLRNVGLNPTRTGIIDVLQSMGASLQIHNERIVNEEPVADLTIYTSHLHGIEIGGALIPRLIDEIPIIALLATQAIGTTIIKDAEELKVKETNRIDTVVEQLTKLGANIEARDDGMVIHGGEALHGGVVDSCGDHRIGMMLAIASCLIEEEVVLQRSDAINVSYPTFFEHLNQCNKK